MTNHDIPSSSAAGQPHTEWHLPPSAQKRLTLWILRWLAIFVIALAPMILGALVVVTLL